MFAWSWGHLVFLFILLFRECSPRDSNAHARDGARRLELRVSSCCTRRAISADGGSRTRMPVRASVLSAVCIPFHHVDGVLRRGVEPPRSRDHCGLNAARFPFRHLSMKCCGPDSSRQFLGLTLGGTSPPPVRAPTVELPRVELGRHAYQACKVMTGPSSSVVTSSAASESNRARALIRPRYGNRPSADR